MYVALLPEKTQDLFESTEHGIKTWKTSKSFSLFNEKRHERPLGDIMSSDSSETYIGIFRDPKDGSFQAVVVAARLSVLAEGSKLQWRPPALTRRNPMAQYQGTVSRQRTVQPPTSLRFGWSWLDFEFSCRLWH